jgi:hypothetical protein
MIAVVTLQFALLAAGYAYLFRHDRIRPKGAQPRTNELVVSLCAAVAFAAWNIRGGTPAETGVAWGLMLPVYSAVAGGCGYLLAVSAGVLVAAVPFLRRIFGLRAPRGPMIAAAAAALIVASMAVQGYLARQTLYADAVASGTGQDRLEEITLAALTRGDLALIATLVDNRNAPAFTIEAAHRHCRTLPKATGLHPCQQIHAALARNWRTPPHILRDLVDNPSETLRLHVATNRRTPAEVLRMLAVDPAFVVRKALAGNTRLPIPVLRTLAADRDPLVQSDASEALQARTGMASPAAKDGGA